MLSGIFHGGTLSGVGLFARRTRPIVNWKWVNRSVAASPSQIPPWRVNVVPSGFQRSAVEWSMTRKLNTSMPPGCAFRYCAYATLPSITSSIVKVSPVFNSKPLSVK
ncbi:hypothetical protein D3C75_472760 [compost metagenome]